MATPWTRRRWRLAFAAAAGLADRLGIAVSVVGGGTMKPLLMFDGDEVLEEMRRNIVSAFLVIRHATPHMTKGGGGSIVCISSDAAKIPWPFLTTYNTSKAGVEGLVRGAALELAPLHVRVNAVRPGLVKTEATKDGLFKNESVMAQFIAEKPLGRTGVPDDIAAGVRYLAGPESSWVTGQSFGIEGGNELTRAPYLDALVRKRFGDAPIDAAYVGPNSGLSLGGPAQERSRPSISMALPRMILYTSASLRLRTICSATERVSGQVESVCG